VRGGRGLLRDALVLVGLAAYALPFFWQVLTSLKPEAELMVLPPLLPSRLTLEHYQVVFERSVMLRAMVNSLGVGAITTVLALGLGLPPSAHRRRHRVSADRHGEPALSPHARAGAA
jgi:ABC-type glycerol-3-phosphate transport system permease component